MTRTKYFVTLLLCLALGWPQFLGAATVTVLYSFKDCTDGGPAGRPLLHKGSVFGTGSGFGSGNGEVFELSRQGGSWKESALHKFGGTDGEYPRAGLLAMPMGHFYGTTEYGGTYDAGTAFVTYKSGRTWKLDTLWNFGSGNDGHTPSCDLIGDLAGDNIYGTTQGGGMYGNGVLFQLTSTGGGWTETVLYSFVNGSDGRIPLGGLVMDKSGVMFGTTSRGGNHDFGTVFELEQSGGVWSETVLYSFSGGIDGGKPGYGELIEGADGTLFGTTSTGGTHFAGTVFRLSQSGRAWKEQVLYSFTGGTDGDSPLSMPAFDGSGGLYGTTVSGGDLGNCGGSGCGVVYELIPSGGEWNESVLHAFEGSDGAFPQAGVITDRAGSLYGTAMYGGAFDYGSVWKLTP